MVPFKSGLLNRRKKKIQVRNVYFQMNGKNFKQNA